MDKNEAIESLRRYLPDGTTVYCILRSRARSGMSRRISLYVYLDGRMQWIDGWVSVALGLARPATDTTGLPVRGCNMDMGHHLVSERLARAVGRDLRHEWL